VVGEVIFREIRVWLKLIGGLLYDSKEFVPLSQPKTPTAEGFLGSDASGGNEWRFT
jgi:hypothetical protein